MGYIDMLGLTISIVDELHAILNGTIPVHIARFYENYLEWRHVSVRCV